MVAGLITDAAEALAHAADVIHRDVNPSNLMVDLSGPRCLIDFGLADAADQRGAASVPRRPVGTPGYIAPQALSSDPAAAAPSSARSDVWGLGATLYEEAFTLRRPVAGTGSVEAPHINRWSSGEITHEHRSALHHGTPW